jgi:hypothetical protein
MLSLKTYTSLHFYYTYDCFVFIYMKSSFSTLIISTVAGWLQINTGISSPKFTKAYLSRLHYSLTVSSEFHTKFFNRFLISEWLSLFLSISIFNVSRMPLLKRYVTHLPRSSVTEVPMTDMTNFPICNRKLVLCYGFITNFRFRSADNMWRILYKESWPYIKRTI